MRTAAVLLALAVAALLSGLAWSEVGVSGVVVDRDGNPVGGVSVAVYDSNGGVVARATTSPSGYFSVALASGTYTLRLSKPGYVEKVITFTVGKPTFSTDLGTIVMDYSLSISMPLTAIELPVLSSASLPLVVSNKGSGVENVSIGVSSNCSLDVGVYSGNVRVGRLALGPGDSQSLTVRVKAPFMEAATCRVTLTFAGSIAHSRDLTVAVLNQPLRLITSSITSIRAAPGAVLQIPVRVVNRLSDPIVAQLSVSQPAGWSAVVKDPAGNIVSSVSLAPGDSLQAVVYLGVPRDVKPGTYNVTLGLLGTDPYFVDAATVSVTVSAGAPVLHLSVATPHLDVYAGKSARYQFTVTNFGEADCLAVFNVTGLPRGYTWSVVDAQGNTLTQVYLPAGGSSTLYLTVGVPPLADPGALSFKLSVRAQSAGDEIPLSLGILGRYALSFVTQNFYLEAAPGSTATFQLTLSNAGYSSLTNLAVTVASAPSGFTVSVDPQSVLLLRPGERATFTVTVTTDPTVDAGDYYITLTVRADQLDSVSRDLHVYIRAPSSPAYAAAAAVAALAVAAVIAFRRFGRR